MQQEAPTETLALPENLDRAEEFIHLEPTLSDDAKRVLLVVAFRADEKGRLTADDEQMHRLTGLVGRRLWDAVEELRKRNCLAAQPPVPYERRPPGYRLGPSRGYPRKTRRAA